MRVFVVMIHDDDQARRGNFDDAICRFKVPGCYVTDTRTDESVGIAALARVMRAANDVLARWLAEKITKEARAEAST